MESTRAFIEDRKYLANVSSRTIEFYEDCFKSVLKWGDFTETGLKRWVIESQKAGISPRSINSRITGVNAYLKWKGEKFRAKKLKVLDRVLPIYSDVHVKRLLGFKPKGRCQKRLHLLGLFTLDTGVRIDEVLSLKWENVDFDNMILKVRGKGNKERLIPFSTELRKQLWVYSKSGMEPSELIFKTRDGIKLMRRNVLRDFKLLCKRLGIVPPPRAIHALRHTFAVNYLKNGGNLYYLSRVLGHSEISTTQMYLKSVGLQDLQSAHQKTSVLMRL